MISLRQLCFLLALGLPAAAFATAPCESEYFNARNTVVAARLPRGSQQKVLTKIVNAWRMATSGSSDGVSGALAQLDQAKQLLSTGPFAVVSDDAKTSVGAGIDNFRTCLASAPALVPVAVTVRAFTAPGVSAGANIAIRVDGVNSAKTDANGIATVTVPEGDHVFTAVASIDTGGTAHATIASGQTTPVDIVLTPGHDFALPADGFIDELNDSVLAPDFPSFTFRLLDAGGKTVKIRQLVRVLLTGAGEESPVTAAFTTKPTGEIVPVDRENLRRTVVGSYGPFTLRVRGIDQQGQTWFGTAAFDAGRYHLGGTLHPSAGTPAGGQAVRITNQADGLTFWATTAANGTFAFPTLLPEGLYIARCDALIGGVRHHGTAAFVLNADKSFTIELQSTADITR